MRISTYVEYRRNGLSHANEAQPPNAALAILLRELDGELTRGGLRLVELDCRTVLQGAKKGAHCYLARITLTCEPGTPSRSLTSWYQWQHPVWRIGADASVDVAASQTMRALAPVEVSAL